MENNAYSRIKKASEALLWTIFIVCLIPILLSRTSTPAVEAQDGENGRLLAQVSSPISPLPGDPISGTVLLQGRTDHAGSDVFLSPNPCPPLPRSADFVAAGLPSAVTNVDGNFEITPTSGNANRCLQAVQHGYLVGQHDSPQGGLGTVQLLGGDVTEDDMIDIFDLAFIARRYQSQDAAADINADGIVDIFDLSITAGNYNQRGPVTSWQ